MMFKAGVKANTISYNGDVKGAEQWFKHAETINQKNIQRVAKSKNLKFQNSKIQKSRIQNPRIQNFKIQIQNSKIQESKNPKSKIQKSKKCNVFATLAISKFVDAMILKLAALSAPQLLSKVSMPGFHDLPANFLLDIFLFACPLRDPHPRHPTEGPDWPARFFFGSPQGSSVYRPFEGGQFLVSYLCLRAFPFVANAFCCFSIHPCIC